LSIFLPVRRPEFSGTMSQNGESLSSEVARMINIITAILNRTPMTNYYDILILVILGCFVGAFDGRVEKGND
jgi:hypothetical protein